MSAAPILLSVEGLNKSYGGVHAVRGVTFALRAGEILAPDGGERRFDPRIADAARDLGGVSLPALRDFIRHDVPQSLLLLDENNTPGPAPAH